MRSSVVPCWGQSLTIHTLAVSLDDIGLDLTDFLVQQRRPILLAVDDGRTCFPDALRTQRVGLPGPAERRLSLLPGLLEWFLRPFRCEGGGRIVFVEVLNRVEGHAGAVAHSGVNKLHRTLADRNLKLSAAVRRVRNRRLIQGSQKCLLVQLCLFPFWPVLRLPEKASPLCAAAAWSADSR